MSYFPLKSLEYIENPSGKRFFNEQLFSLISSEYDSMTRVLSFFRDQAWKKDLLAHLPEIGKPVCLDIACGTGDFVRLLSNKYPAAQIIGLDYTESMLCIAKQGFESALWTRQDMQSLAIASNSIDIITGGYALRNSPVLENTLDEIARVIKPNGVAAFLDFSKAENILIQKLEFFLLKLWGGFWGFILHRNPDAYAYIADSLERFPNTVELCKLFALRNMQEVYSRLCFFGIAEIKIFKKNS